MQHLQLQASEPHGQTGSPTENATSVLGAPEPGARSYLKFVFDLAGVGLGVQPADVVIERAELAHGDGGVATQACFQDGVVHKYILLLQRHGDRQEWWPEGWASTLRPEALHNGHGLQHRHCLPYKLKDQTSMFISDRLSYGVRLGTAPLGITSQINHQLRRLVSGSAPSAISALCTCCSRLLDTPTPPYALHVAFPLESLVCIHQAEVGAVASRPLMHFVE